MAEEYKFEEVSLIKGVPAKILHQTVTGQDCYVPLHWHKEPEINLMLTGTTDFTINGTAHRVSRGDFVLINSRDIHKGELPPEIAPKDGYLELLTIQLDYDFLCSYAEDDPAPRFDMCLDPEIQKQIRDLIIEIGVTNFRKPKYYEMKITAMLLTVENLLLEYCSVPRDESLQQLEKNMRRMQDAISYIQKHYTEDLTLPVMAEQMGLAPTYFSRKFKQMTGITFHECLARERARHSLEDLMNSDMTTTEIAYRNGFPNVKSFITAFKEYYELTPQKYRRENRP